MSDKSELRRYAQNLADGPYAYGTGQQILDLFEELELADKIIAERNKLLDAIPSCPVHGQCVPYAIEWVEKAMVMIKELSAENEKLRNSSMLWQCKPGIGLIRCVPDSRYQKFSPDIRQHYFPVLMVEDGSLRKDAERYRWLRKTSIPLEGHDFLSTGEILDFRIDDKISKESGQ